MNPNEIMIHAIKNNIMTYSVNGGEQQTTDIEDFTKVVGSLTLPPVSIAEPEEQ